MFCFLFYTNLECQIIYKSLLKLFDINICAYQLKEYLFLLFTYSGYFLFFLAFTGLWQDARLYLDDVTSYYKIVIGIVLKEIPYVFGEKLSPEMEKAVPKAIDLTLKEIEKMRINN